MRESDRRQRTIETMGRGCFRVALESEGNDGAHRSLLYSRVFRRERLLKLPKEMGRQTRSGKRAVKCNAFKTAMREENVALSKNRMATAPNAGVCAAGAAIADGVLNPPDPKVIFFLVIFE